MTLLEATYTHGTHRLIPPEATLARITPHLAAMGITRAADVTGLDDDLGVPTYCAIRPAARTLQTCNGKGLTRASAKVSALMEAIELFHAEHPDRGAWRRASVRTMKEQNQPLLRPEAIRGFYENYFSTEYVLDWVAGEDLVSGERVWVPAGAVFFGCEPMLHYTSTNGLASGNHVVEATLHALYELIERDSISRISVNGRLKIRERCRVVSTTTVADPQLQAVLHHIQAARNRLVLLWISSAMPVHTFWAILLNHDPFSSDTTLNMGYGAHTDITVAAARAITEAVQCRLTLVHGSREDLAYDPNSNRQQVLSSRAYQYFNSLVENTSWSDIEAQGLRPTHDLQHTYQRLLHSLVQVGHAPIIRVNLTQPRFEIPVVKTLVPSLLFNRKLI